ncbi:hypothetical protein FPOAC2_02841 [Fusarium poae]
MEESLLPKIEAKVLPSSSKCSILPQLGLHPSIKAGQRRQEPWQMRYIFYINLIHHRRTISYEPLNSSLFTLHLLSLSCHPRRSMGLDLHLDEQALDQAVIH